jgi:hypothetical protein
VAAIALLSCNFARKSAHGNFGQKRKKEQKVAIFDGIGIRPSRSFASFIACFAPLRATKKCAQRRKEKCKESTIQPSKGNP